MILRRDRHSPDAKLAYLNQSYRFARSKKLPVARDAQRHLHYQLGLTVFLPAADQNLDRHFHSIGVDEGIDVIPLSFHDLRCLRWRAVAESCGHYPTVSAILQPAAAQNLGRHFHSIGMDLEIDAIRLSFRDLRCSHWRAVAESCGHYPMVSAVLQPAAGQNLGHHFHSTDAIRLNSRDLRCPHWRAVAESCAHYPAVSAIHLPAAPGFPARDHGHWRGDADIADWWRHSPLFDRDQGHHCAADFYCSYRYLPAGPGWIRNFGFQDSESRDFAHGFADPDRDCLRHSLRWKPAGRDRHLAEAGAELSIYDLAHRSRLVDRLRHGRGARHHRCLAHCLQLDPDVLPDWKLVHLADQEMVANRFLKLTDRRGTSPAFACATCLAPRCLAGVPHGSPNLRVQLQRERGARAASCSQPLDGRGTARAFVPAGRHVLPERCCATVVPEDQP
jgi:hypothetical protein